jgi:CHASE1-domain containing sensor protein
VAIIILSIILITTISTITYKFSENTLKNEVEEKLERQAKNNADAIEKDLLKIESYMQSISSFVEASIDVANMIKLI